MSDNETTSNLPVSVTSACRIWPVLAVFGTLILVVGGWLVTNVQASAVERAVLKSKLESMADDVRDIKKLLSHALEEEDKR